MKGSFRYWCCGWGACGLRRGWAHAMADAGWGGAGNSGAGVRRGRLAETGADWKTGWVGGGMEGGAGERCGAGEGWIGARSRVGYHDTLQAWGLD